VIFVRDALAQGRVNALHELPDGQGLLQFAVRVEALQCIPELMAHGAKAAEKDRTGRSALDYVIAGTDGRLPALLSRTYDAPSSTLLSAEAGNSVTVAGGSALADELAKLASLHATGALTKEEFASAKNQVLAGGRA
jgi:hypothetical protein